MTVEKLDVKNIQPIPLDNYVKVKEMGNIIEIKDTGKSNRRQSIQLLPGGREYIVLRTGEIKEIQTHSSKRVDNVDRLRQSIKDVREIINTNITDNRNALWVTLTYAENMQDHRQLGNDLKNFFDRLETYCKNREIEKPEYIAVPEPQGRGAWHVHMFLIWQHKAPFIANDELAKVWGHGFTVTKAIRGDINNLGAYITPYLTNIPLDKYDGDKDDIDIIDTEVANDDGEIESKKFVKGARLALYPARFRIYRTSAGIKKPTVKTMMYIDARRCIKGVAKTYEDAYKITRGDFENIIHREYYNKAL